MNEGSKTLENRKISKKRKTKCAPLLKSRYRLAKIFVPSDRPNRKKLENGFLVFEKLNARTDRHHHTHNNNKRSIGCVG